MGTSAPEVAASISAAIHNSGNIAIGNVYGSNIANLALIGGITSMVYPITIKRSIIRKELPAVLITSLILWPLFADLLLTRLEAAGLLTLFGGLLGYTVYNAAKGRQTDLVKVEPAVEKKTLKMKNSLPGAITLLALGLIALAAGAEITVRSAVFLGKFFGLSTSVIGLTVIAVGTSLPELVTCLIAALKKHEDISIGNLLGSNIFNTLLVIGTAGSVKPFQVAKRLIGTDYWIMIAVSAFILMIAVISGKITRIWGAILTSGYIVYIAYLLAFTARI